MFYVAKVLIYVARSILRVGWDFFLLPRRGQRYPTSFPKNTRYTEITRTTNVYQRFVPVSHWKKATRASQLASVAGFHYQGERCRRVLRTSVAAATGATAAASPMRVVGVEAAVGARALPAWAAVTACAMHTRRGSATEEARAVSLTRAAEGAAAVAAAMKVR